MDKDNNDKVTALRLWLPMLDELMLGSRAGQKGINDLKIRVNNLIEEVQQLKRELKGNVDNDDHVNHGETVPTNDVLEENNTIGAHIVEGNEDSFYEWMDTYDEWNGYYHSPTEEYESGSSHTFTGNNNMFTVTKIKHDGTPKTRLVVKHLHR